MEKKEATIVYSLSSSGDDTFSNRPSQKLRAHSSFIRTNDQSESNTDKRVSKGQIEETVHQSREFPIDFDLVFSLENNTNNEQPASHKARKGQQSPRQAFELLQSIAKQQDQKHQLWDALNNDSGNINMSSKYFTYNAVVPINIKSEYISLQLLRRIKGNYGQKSQNDEFQSLNSLQPSSNMGQSNVEPQQKANISVQQQSQNLVQTTAFAFSLNTSNEMETKIVQQTINAQQSSAVSNSIDDNKVISQQQDQVLEQLVSQRPQQQMSETIQTNQEDKRRAAKLQEMQQNRIVRVSIRNQPSEDQISEELTPEKQSVHQPGQNHQQEAETRKQEQALQLNDEEEMDDIPLDTNEVMGNVQNDQGAHISQVLEKQREQITTDPTAEWQAEQLQQGRTSETRDAQKEEAESAASQQQNAHNCQIEEEQRGQSHGQIMQQSDGPNYPIQQPPELRSSNQQQKALAERPDTNESTILPYPEQQAEIAQQQIQQESPTLVCTNGNTGYSTQVSQCNIDSNQATEGQQVVSTAQSTSNYDENMQTFGRLNCQEVDQSFYKKLHKPKIFNQQKVDEAVFLVIPKKQIIAANSNLRPLVKFDLPQFQQNRLQYFINQDYTIEQLMDQFPQYTLSQLNYQLRSKRFYKQAYYFRKRQEIQVKFDEQNEAIKDMKYQIVQYYNYVIAQLKATARQTQ